MNEIHSTDDMLDAYAAGELQVNWSFDEYDDACTAAMYEEWAEERRRELLAAQRLPVKMPWFPNVRSTASYDDETPF